MFFWMNLTGDLGQIGLLGGNPDMIQKYKAHIDFCFLYHFVL